MHSNMQLDINNPAEMDRTGVVSVSDSHKVSLLSVVSPLCWRAQNETLSSLKALLKHIDQSQLTRDLDGSFHYDHSHWIHFRQVGVTSRLGEERWGGRAPLRQSYQV